MKALLILATFLAASSARAALFGAAPAPLPLERVEVGVRDLPAAVAWLEKTLGWTPDFRGATRAVFVSSGTRVALAASEADSAATLVLGSEDADADYKRLTDAGAQGVAAPEDKASGYREAVVRGPGALRVRLEGPLAAPPDFLYTDVAPGSGASPAPTDTVKVLYVGRLKDGTVFDGAHARGRAAMIPLASAIPCWSRALPRMKVGGKARFSCPPGLAFGKAGRPPLIPPDATLDFEIELVGVLK